jgi:hypothetical protein
MKRHWTSWGCCTENKQNGYLQRYNPLAYRPLLKRINLYLTLNNTHVTIDLNVMRFLRANHSFLKDSSFASRSSLHNTSIPAGIEASPPHVNEASDGKYKKHKIFHFVPFS